MVKVKQEKDPVTNIVQSISYGTGLICAKVSKLGKVTKTKEWQGVVSKTQGIVKNVEKTVMDSVADMKESFEEGVKSIVKEEQKIKAQKLAMRGKKEVVAEEAEIVSEEKEVAVQKEDIALQEEKIVVQKEEVAFQEEEIAGQKEEVAVQKQEIAAQEKEVVVEEKKLAAQELKEAETSLKATKREKDPSEFSMEEFKKEGKDPKGLMGSIKKNKPEISLTATNPLEWLNELLSKGQDGHPLKYDIKQTAEIKQATEAFEADVGEEKVQKLIKLNRLILEQAYPLKCPKLQIREPKKTVKTKADKTKSKNPKSSKSGLNLN